MVKKMKRYLNKIVILSLVLFAQLFISCGAKWTSDFEEAKKLSAKKKQPILLFLNSGDTAALDFKTNFLDTKEFISAAGKNFVLLSLDAVTEEEQKVDEILSLVADYSVKEILPLIILNKDGYYVGRIEKAEKIETIKELTEQLLLSTPDFNKIEELSALIKSSNGTDKVRAIDELFEYTDENCRRPLHSLCEQVLAEDAGNITGLLGKYELQIVFDQVYDMLTPVTVDDAAERFVSLAKNGHLDNAQKFEAYYYAAYLYPLVGSSNYEKMLELLNLSYSADPHNENASEIAIAIQTIQSMMDYYDSNSQTEVTPE